MILRAATAPYTPTVAGAIVLLKYEELAPLAAGSPNVLRRLARSLPESCVPPTSSFQYRCIRPGLRERGYNQAELIATPLARDLGLALPLLSAGAQPTPSGQANAHVTRALAVGSRRLRDPSGHAG